MSFALDVFSTVLPDDLTQAWVAGLAEHGLVVEPHPRFNLRQWRGGWATFKLSAQVEGYPAHSVSAGFELDVGGNAEAHEMAEYAPDHFRGVVEQAVGVFHFSTPSGRTVADLRLQSLGAAVLADISQGALYDPQRGAFLAGTEVFQNALQEAASFESSAEPASWECEAFAGWNGAG